MRLSSPDRYLSRRRPVDWSRVTEREGAGVAPSPTPASSELLAVLRVIDLLPERCAPDTLLRRAVELLRGELGLERVGVFICDWEAGRMRGTWGTGARGETTDEHGFWYAIGEHDRQAMAQAQSGEARWMLIENCPLVVPEVADVKVIRLGWAARTPILGPEAPIGMMFNDAGLSGQPASESQQAQAALVCRVLGLMMREPPLSGRSTDVLASRGRPMGAVARALELVRQDPSLDGLTLGARVGVSPSHLLRLIKSETGASLVDHRNRFRLARFMEALVQDTSNLLGAALDAGFGSYAQFHRVFRKYYGCSPREYLEQKVLEPKR